MKSKKEIDRRDSQFWIDRCGYIYKYLNPDWEDRVSLHSDIVQELFPDVENASNYCMLMGWILVGSSVYHSPIIDIRPSQAQINILYKLKLYKNLLILHNGEYINYAKSF